MSRLTTLSGLQRFRSIFLESQMNKVVKLDLLEKGSLPSQPVYQDLKANVALSLAYIIVAKLSTVYFFGCFC